MNPLLRVPLGLLFPHCCLVCKEDVPWTQSGDPSTTVLCVDCHQHFRNDARPDCSVNSSLHFVMSAGVFAGPLRSLIHAFKYQGKDWLAPFLGKFLDFALILDWEKIDALVPIPMTYWKEIRRGYNQSQLLAEELGRRHGIPILNRLLRRTLLSPPQVGLSKKERKENARRSYHLRMNRPTGAISRILLIDDVVTTGSTLNQCAELLRSIGVQEVTAAVLARDDLKRSKI